MIPITYFSDVLCIWAYIAQLRVDELQRRFGDQIRIEPKCCSVFGATARKISTTWRDKGGYEGFNQHLRHIGAQFPELTIRPDLWLEVRPASSTGAHLMVKAVELMEASEHCAPKSADQVMRALRRAFFEAGRDISSWAVQAAVVEETGLQVGMLEAKLRDGAAFAALACDLQDAEANRIQGSPSFVLNEGRQSLYGNVGFRVLEANIQELLRTPRADQASWC